MTVVPASDGRSSHHLTSGFGWKISIDTQALIKVPCARKTRPTRAARSRDENLERRLVARVELIALSEAAQGPAHAPKVPAAATEVDSMELSIGTILLHKSARGIHSVNPA